MAARTIEVADAVLAKLQAATLSQAFAQLTRNYADWEFPLETMVGIVCDVVPSDLEVALLSRGSLQYSVSVDIAIRYKFQDNELDDKGRPKKELVDALCLLYQQVVELFTPSVFDTEDNFAWSSTLPFLPYVPHHLRQFQQFTGLVRVNFLARKLI